MTDIERKALALVNEVSDGFHDVASIYDIHTAKALRSALCRAIEQHEAFRQEVSDAVEQHYNAAFIKPVGPLARFIIAKPDPLVEALNDMAEDDDWYDEHHAKVLRAAIEKRGGKITWGEG